MGRGLRAMLVAALGMMLLAVAGGTAWADAFNVSGVRVDVRAASAAQAREQALRQGQVEAFRRMMSVLVSDGDRARLADPSADEIETMVSDLSVADERASATRYIASLTVHFDPARVNAFLQARGISVVKGSDESVILLGVYRDAPGAAPQLWEETNPWRPLLTNAAVSRGLFPVVVPLGDIEDVAQAPAEKALALDAAGLDALMARYGADAVVVAEAVMTPGQGASLTLKGYPRAIPASLSRLESPVADDPDAALGDLAAHAVLAVARAAKPQTGGTMVGEFDQLAILVPVQGLADWVRVDRTLRALPGVRGVSLRASRPDVVQAAVQYAGDPEALRQAMTRVGFAVTQREGYWEVVPGGEPATPLAR
ncbi:conserved exported hypothetical protein [uncultured Alphaproteobacteria bacterium]|uniref:DUF2066 domain-containing protein n=1 Tax=uncultured Alphaproteobacteria bacterium TaxID=91750 RepID=A0A212JJE1_9PROT|nr:conserved exported hypothetical protein [uncultured Alphaproteobacteria bacterium]